ncbi:MAG: hypothetical protein WDA16_11005 [Candidatus Thermoplasmatota archaeon]
MPSADALILARAELDLDAGIAHTRQLVRQNASPAFLAGAYEAVVNTTLASIHLKTRFRDDVTFLMELAHRVNGGDDPEVLARENLARAVHLKELALIAREKDPEFQPILDATRAHFALRLPDLARMVAVKSPASYSDLVREAFSHRAEVEGIVQANHDHVIWIVDHLEAHPHLLRLPHALVPRLAKTAREVLEWQTARVKRGVDEIYAGALE